MRSAWRGEARNTSIPSRLMSKSAAPTDIISMAQHASPKVTGQTLLRRAHLTRSSIRPVRKLCWRSSRPTDAPGLRGLAGARPLVGPQAGDGGLGGARRRCRVEALSRAPIQRAVADEVDEGDEHHPGEHEDLHQAESPQVA